MSCKSKAVALGAIGIFVLFVAVANAGETSVGTCRDSASGYQPTDDAGEVLAELEYILEMLEEAKAECEEQKSEEKCIIALSILYTFNACWLMHDAGWLPKADPSLAERFEEIASEIFRETEDVSQLKAVDGMDNKGKELYYQFYPWWYFNFYNTDTDDPDSRRASYIEVTYSSNNERKLVLGSILFQGQFISMPVLWNVEPGETQTIYFSCYLDCSYRLTDRLRLLAAYWDHYYNMRSYHPMYPTFGVYGFCEEYYCPCWNI